MIKYIDEDGQQRALVADSNPFKGMENYCTDALHYQEALNVEDELDSGKEVDVEPEPAGCKGKGWHLRPSPNEEAAVVRRSTACEEGMWYIND